MQEACEGLVAVMQHSPKRMSRLKEAGFSEAIIAVACCGMIQDNAIRECALRCLALLTAGSDPPRVCDADAAKLIPALVAALRPHTPYSAAGIEDAIALLRRVAHGVGHHQQVVAAGGVTALLLVLEAPGAPPEQISEAAAVLVSLVDAPFYPGLLNAVKALATVLRLPAAEASHAPAVSAMFALSQSCSGFDSILTAGRPEGLQVMLQHAIGMIGEAAAAPQQAQRELREHLMHKLCVFAARSSVHAAAVLRQGGVPVLVEAMGVGPAEGRRAAADALWLVAAKGGPQGRIAILEARRCLDVQLASA